MNLHDGCKSRKIPMPRRRSLLSAKERAASRALFQMEIATNGSFHPGHKLYRTLLPTILEGNQEAALFPPSFLLNKTSKKCVLILDFLVLIGELYCGLNETLFLRVIERMQLACCRQIQVEPMVGACEHPYMHSSISTACNYHATLAYFPTSTACKSRL